MKNLLKITLVLTVIALMGSCELFEAEDSTLNLQERLINHPLITLNGDVVTVIDSRLTNPAYEDAGAVANFGPADVTSTMITTGVETVESNIPGFYAVNYAVTTTNSLETEVTATATRTVLVLNPDDDATGQWNCNANTVFGAVDQLVNFSSRVPGVYTIDANATMALGIIGLNGTTEIRIAEDVVVMPEHNLAPFSNTWLGAGSVISRDPATNQITSFSITWNSPQFRGGSTAGVSTYTRP